MDTLTKNIQNATAPENGIWWIQHLQYCDYDPISQNTPIPTFYYFLDLTHIQKQLSNQINGN